MRVRTILLLIILVTGVAFSQEGQDTDRIEFKTIKYFLSFKKVIVLEGSGFYVYLKANDRIDVSYSVK